VLRRAFVAVVPPPAVLDVVESRVDATRSSAGGLRWARRDQWHCTLQFFGLVPDAESLVAALGAGLEPHPQFRMQLDGAGAFPSPGRGTVLWLGISDGRQDLVAIAGSAGAATAALGFGAEARPFSPHLTIARASQPTDLAEPVAALGSGPAGPPWLVDEVVLLESATLPTGAVYREVARFPLSG
jgi:2'-5' RNA ligase